MRSRRIGLLTSRAPGVSFNTASARAASAFSTSRFWPVMRMAIGASIGGPFSKATTVMRAPGYLAKSARRLSSTLSLLPGFQASKLA